MGGEKRAPWRSLTSLRRGLDAMFSQNIGDGALGPVANTDTKLLIYGLFQKGRVLAQDGILDADIRGFFDAINHGWLMKVVEHRTLHPYPEQRLRVMT